MKKIILISILLLLFEMSAWAFFNAGGSTTVNVSFWEVTKGGASVADSPDDFEFIAVLDGLADTVSQNGPGCMIITNGVKLVIGIDYQAFHTTVVSTHSITIVLKQKSTGLTVEKKIPAPLNLAFPEYSGVDGIDLNQGSVPPTITISIGPGDLAFCQGASSGTVLTAKVDNADPGFTVVWESNGGAIPGLSASGLTANFSGVAPGVYPVVAKVNGVSSNEVTVEVKAKPAKPVIQLNPSIVCVGDEVIASVQGGEQAGVTYAWTPTNASNASTATYTAVNAATTYSVIPTLNGCQGDKSDDALLTFKPILAVSGEVKIECKVDRYQAIVKFTGDGGGTIRCYEDFACTQEYVHAQWAGKTQVTLQNLTLGAHDFFFKGDNSCGVLPVPVNDNGKCTCGARLAITGGGEYCAGATISEIVVKATLSSEFDRWTVKVKDPSNNLILDIQDERSDKEWRFTPTESGLYTITEFVAYDADNHSCGEITGNNSVRVTINPVPVLNSFTVSKAEGCFGEDLKLEAIASQGTQPYKYIWTGEGAPAGEQTVNVVNTTIAAGDKSYTVQVKDGKNCTTAVSEAKHVIGHQVTVTASALASTVLHGSSTTLNSSASFIPVTEIVDRYEWKPQEMINGDNTLQNPKTVNLTAKQKYDVEIWDTFGCSGKNSVTVNVSGTELAVTVTGGSACYGTELKLSCTPEGGTGDGNPTKYTYTWIPQGALVFERTDVREPIVDATTPAGKYKATVQVHDDVNTVTSEEVEVEVKAKPVLSQPTATPSSGLNAVTSTLKVTVVPEDAPLAWTPPEKIASGVNSTTAKTEVLNASQTFTVKASLNGCFDEKSIEVTVTTTDMIVDVAGAQGCAGANLAVEANPRGGSGNYTYQWGSSTPDGVVLSSKTAKRPSIQNSSSLSGGTYSIPVKVDDGNGQAKEGIAVLKIFDAVEAESTAVCNGDKYDAVITVKKGEKPFTLYSDAAATIVVENAVWNADGDVVTVPDLASGSAHTYYLKDKNACNIKRLQVTADCSCGAQLVMIMGDKFCASSNKDIEILLQASGGESYSFDLVNVELGRKVLEVKNETASEWTYPVSYADRGKYRVDNFEAVTAVSKPGACKGNVTPAEIDIQFHPTPRVDAGQDQKICGTEQVILKANGGTGLTFAWDKDVMDGVPFPPVMGVPTIYTVTATDVNGCTNTDQVQVTANPKPTVSAMATPNVVCRGDVVNLSSNGDANTYTWDNGGQDGPNNMPETTTKYTVTGTNTTTECSDTASVIVVVNLPAEIVERPKDRTIAIGKDVTYSVKAIGNDLTYSWLWWNQTTNVWTSFTDNTATSPKVSGSATAELILKEVPESWDGRKVKCIVTGSCGTPVEAEANLWVKECFDITVDLQMLSGIRPETTPGSAVDGWYCKGNKIALKAVVALADPEYGTVANPHFTWTIDGLPAQKVIESDSSVLSWIPEYYEDDIVIRVCAYSDGACDEVCSRYLRLKARTPDDVRLQIVTSADPDRKFCPGDTIDFTVALKNEGRDMNIHWYRDIFDKGTGRNKTFVMDQKDTWIKAVYVPSAEQCVENVVSDSAFLQVKEYVHPTLRIENNIGDTIACQGDSLLFRAIWSNAGANPLLSWRQDIWDRGYGEYALIGLNDKDTWVECRLTPGNDVCFSGPALRDTMVIRVRENGTVTIAADMQDKLQGDLLTFVSEVKGMTGSWEYSWYVNTNMTSCVEKDYSTDVLKQGDVVQCAINGHRVCLNKVFSNEIVVDYVNGVERDTMLYIYQNEIVQDMDMAKPCDIGAHVVFMIETQAGYGTSTITPDGKFTYIPNPGFVGTDLVKYVIRNRTDKVITAEGYIYITVKNNARFLVPNIITPNDDGLNDTWKLDFLADYPNHIITIFDRSGQIVFEGRKYQNDWDGTGMAKGGYVARINLVNGVYTYVIDLGDKDKTILKSWIEIRANLNRRNYR